VSNGETGFWQFTDAFDPDPQDPNAQDVLKYVKQIIALII
jgi:hypothetical protein